MAVQLPIYLDHHSTTPVDPRVEEAMRPYFGRDFGNAASRTHAFGWKAEGAVKKARAQVAALIGASEAELVFTSGATESNNLALKGAVGANAAGKGAHVVTVATEHKAVLDPLQRLERERALHEAELGRLRLEELLGRAVGPEEVDALALQHGLGRDATYARWLGSYRRGAKVTVLGVEPDGRLPLDALARALTPDTVLVSVMLANNETGVLQPVDEIGALCRSRGVLFHCDASQGVGKVPFDVERAQVDLVSFTAHKLYGPKGIGALYVRRRPRVKLASLLDGGGHERGLRSGTLPVPLIVGFGEACRLAGELREEEARRVLALRGRLLQGLEARLQGVSVNGSLTQRLPGNLNVSFEGVEADALLLALKDVALSSGSACTSASLEPSYVLKALGVPEARARGALRFGIGRFNTGEEIDYTVDALATHVERLRAVTRAAGMR